MPVAFLVTPIGSDIQKRKNDERQGKKKTYHCSNARQTRFSRYM